LPDRLLSDGAVVVDDQGKIEFVGKATDLPKRDGHLMDLSGRILAPGFIDIHVHGGNGVTFGDGNLAEGTATYSKWVVSKGVTGYLMSVAQSSKDLLIETIKDYVKIYRGPPQGAETLGLHLEGPFLNPEKKGAFNPKWLRSPDLDEMKAYIKAGEGWIQQMTLAPELPGAGEIAKMCTDSDILVALGHSNTNFDEAQKALKGNFRHVTHTFNAQKGFNHREPGVLGAVLDSEDIFAELIADTVHVHPAAMRVLMHCVGSDRVVAITDAMTGAGLPDGVYQLAGYDVTVKDGRATLADGTIAGSIATLDGCVANLINYVGLSLAEAVNTASLNPARAIGVVDRLGSIEKGKDASLIVIDESINVFLAMVNGEIVYNKM
jgi:N-acetylglucosamine-6-phosphate deacetylase